jgi:hypothetical protein
MKKAGIGAGRTRRFISREAAGRTRCSTSERRRVQGRTVPMNLDLRDYALRGLILLAGGLSALLLTMQGHGLALPAVAIGGALGALCASKLQSAE